MTDNLPIKRYKRLFQMVYFSIWILATGWVSAEVSLPNVISDNMVLQQGATVSVWGWGDPGEKVTVTFNDAKSSATTGKDCAWRVDLGPLKPGGPFEMVIKGRNVIKIQNVLVGEVWFCSGQSNMAMAVNGCRDYKKEKSAAKYPEIRMFTTKKATKPQPQNKASGSWAVCDPETVGNFSGTAYFFGRAIHNKLKVPVGLIHSSWGGTPAQAWTPEKTLATDPALKTFWDGWQQALKDYPQEREKYQRQLAAWQKEVDLTKAAGKTPPRKPRGPLGPGSSGAPGGLFNAMVVPFTPYRIRGVIWYQGEANAGQGKLYEPLFSRMIQDWRKAWGQGDFPFLFVQLPNHRVRVDLPVQETSNWALLRESQFRTLGLPNTGMAITIDIGEADNIHPKNKQDVGYRLALLALGKIYGEKIEFSGPLYDRMTVESSKIRISFQHTDGGLTAKGGTLKGFAVAGKDGAWYPADAVIEGNTVVVSNPKITKPTRVRYGWADNPDVNLYNGAGLPAAPFRTDR
jgi:sialate O-acetylesterase